MTDTSCVLQSRSSKHSICDCRLLLCIFRKSRTYINLQTKLVTQAETKRAVSLPSNRLIIAARRQRIKDVGDDRPGISHIWSAVHRMVPHRSFVEAGIPAMRQYLRLCYYLPATMHARPGIFISQTFRQKTLAGERRNAVELSMHSSVTPYKQFTS
jgi:hypothetical protein